MSNVPGFVGEKAGSPPCPLLLWGACQWALLPFLGYSLQTLSWPVISQLNYLFSIHLSIHLVNNYMSTHRIPGSGLGSW